MGQVIAPNNLPITCWKADGTELEHEHADHPTYMFPVKVRPTGERPMFIEEYDCSWEDESHALIYCDGTIALTMYEYCYAIWHVRDGQLLGGSLWEKDAYILAPESREEILKRATQPSKGSK